MTTFTFTLANKTIRDLKRISISVYRRGTV